MSIHDFSGDGYAERVKGEWQEWLDASLPTDSNPW